MGRISNDWSKCANEEALKLYERLKDYSKRDNDFGSKLRITLKSLESGYRLYGSEYICGSFNGGKDAVVILHLLRAVHAKFENEEKKSPKRLRVIYFENDFE